MEVLSQSSEETKNLAQRLLSQLGERNILALAGDLGSGKTTLVQGLGRGLGIEKYIISPTFTIMKTYDLSSRDYSWTRMVHIDLYRVGDLIQAEDLGLREIWQDQKNLVVIEWPEVINRVLPPKQTRPVQLEYVGENQRKISW